MMRSLSTSAFGQPSETKLTRGARGAGCRFSMARGYPSAPSGASGLVSARRFRTLVIEYSSLRPIFMLFATELPTADVPAGARGRAQEAPRERSLAGFHFGGLGPARAAALVLGKGGPALPLDAGK